MVLLPSGQQFTRGAIDRVGEEFLHSASAAVMADIRHYRAFRMACLDTSLRILDQAQISADRCIGIRLKRLDSIRRKLMRPCADFTLSRLDDIIGIRIILPSYSDVIDASKRIQELNEHDKVKNYLSGDHYLQTGYRAIHHIMKFQQSLSENQKIMVRFEVQLRSYYQNLWANWSESHGENIKQGGGIKLTESDKALIAELQEVSNHIASWEEQNPSVRQDNGILPSACEKRLITVAWKQPSGEIEIWTFRDFKGALAHLSYLENKSPHQRNNALLLTGIDESENMQRVLRETHPNYILGQTYHPKYWMPDQT